MVNGVVTEVLIATTAGADLEPQLSVHAEAGKGLVGDRYYQGVGTFSEKLKGTPEVEVTLIESEEIAAFNSVTQQSLSPSAFRRNLVTKGIRLNKLEGKPFTIGDVQLKGIRLCEPCAHLAGILGHEIMQHMVHKSGLRAQVISSGEITPSSEMIG